ncbi:hypothetical protein HBA54_02460 [Pelagibius litoralis]|uniref:Uncharacterized protein n=1 Tax=Pelagibius litoralis TaxID=374515 RepID=A0A967EX32_9PROT|nr:hypothetical protein [Pelagibius litoralis]NIA67445.1 hypothetical protein [Pelagibius litoralis]
MKLAAFWLIVAGSVLPLMLVVKGGAADRVQNFEVLLEVEIPAVSEHELSQQQAKGLSDQGFSSDGVPDDWGVILWDEIKPMKPGAPQPQPQPGRGQSSFSASQSR